MIFWFSILWLPGSLVLYYGALVSGSFVAIVLLFYGYVVSWFSYLRLCDSMLYGCIVSGSRDLCLSSSPRIMVLVIMVLVL